MTCTFARDVADILIKEITSRNRNSETFLIRSVPRVVKLDLNHSQGNINDDADCETRTHNPSVIN